MHIRGTIVILFAVTFLILASSAPMAQTPTKWESVLKWREVETKDQEKETAKAVRRIVEQIIEPADKPKDASWKRSAPSKACELEFRALQALALMQALPFLAEGGEVSDRKLFESEKALSRTAVNKVLEDSLPEYWETVKEMATAKEGDPYDPSSAWTVREKLYTDRAYSVPVLLMCLEYYFAGGLEIAYEKGRHRTDRPARPSFRPIGRAQLGIARLTALLLMPGVSSVAGEDKYSTQVFDAPLKGGAIWQYRLLGAAPDLSCCHKSGFAMMGLRAALNLGLLEFDEKAFKFPFDGKAPLGQERFRNRLADVLIHCVLTILSVPNELTDAKNSIGVTGFESYKRLDASRTEKVPAISDGSRSIDLSKYRALYGSNAGGRRILSVEYAESLPGLPTDTPREAAYRYLPGDGFRFGTYHTASAAYILATAANALPLLLPSDGGAVGRGRFHRLLETALSRDMQAVECRTQPELPNELKTTFHVDHPEAVDLLRRIVHERLRVSFTPAWVPKIGPGSAWKPLVWAGKGSGQVPLICAANGPKTTPGNSPGRILLFLLDPQYESVMHRLRDAELSGWTDYGATTTFDKNEFPESASVGVRLRVGSPGAELPTYCLHLSVHPVLDEGPVFLMEEAERTTPLSAKMEVIVRPSLGLSQRNEIRLVQASAFGQEAREVATKLSGKSVIELVKPHSTTSASESVELKPGGTVFVISKATLDQLMKDFGAPTSPFPQHLPPLIECKLVVEGSKPFATSVFAPVPPRFLRAQGQELYFGGSLDFAPPAVQVIDGLLEFLGKKKTMELETQADGLSFRLLSKAAGNSVPTASEIVVSVAETGAVVPPSDYSVDLSLPAQAIVRLRATATKWAGQRLKVTIRKTSGHEEEHYAFLPGSPHETPEAPRRVSLTPSELGIVAPRPEEFILDTLAAITMPETLRADLDSTGDTSRREFQAPHRGILGLPMTTSQAPSVASFTKDFVRIRTEARHSRGWYLMAMVAFSGSSGFLVGDF